MFRIMFFTFVIAAIAAFVLLISNKNARLWVKSLAKRKDDNPHEKLQKIIDKQIANKQTALFAVNSSEQCVRALEQAYKTLKDDLTVLNSRFQKAVADKRDADAKLIIHQMNSKEKKMNEKETELKHAIQKHEELLAIISKYEEAIQSLRTEAKQLKIEDEFAKTSKIASEFELDMKTNLDLSGIGSLKDEIKQKITQNQNVATLNRSIKLDPHSEYLEELNALDDDKKIDDQLEQMKNKLGIK